MTTDGAVMLYAKELTSRIFELDLLAMTTDGAAVKFNSYQKDI
jgi:hypothetical protein